MPHTHMSKQVNLQKQKRTRKGNRNSQSKLDSARPELRLNNNQAPKTNMFISHGIVNKLFHVNAI